MVALRECRRTTAAVVVFPLTGEWFYAAQGKGAFRNGVPLGTASPPEKAPRLKEMWVDMNEYGNSQWASAEFRALKARLQSPEGCRLVSCQVPHSGIAMRLVDGSCGLSAVVHDNNPARVKQAPWDIVAPQLIVQECGGNYWTISGAVTDPFTPTVNVVALCEATAMAIVRLLSAAKEVSLTRPGASGEFDQLEQSG
eukprot:RCo022142